MKISYQEIISKYCQGQMLAQPDFYSGRGNNPGDLNSDLLETIYNGIKIEIGPSAASQFVRMVSDLVDDASATTFLIALKHLERNGWEYRSSDIPETPEKAFTETITDIYKEDPKKALSSFQFGLAASIFSGRQKNEKRGGIRIISEFLRRRKAEQIESEVSHSPNSPEFY